MIKSYLCVSVIAAMSLMACEKDGKLTSHMVELGVPEIASFEPQSGKPGSQVHVTGNNFSDLPANITVTVGDLRASVLSHTMQDLYFLVPDPGVTSSGIIYIEINGKSAFSSTDFTITTPWTTKAKYPGSSNTITEVFVLNGKGYVIGVYDEDGVKKNSLWVYDPDLNTWSRKADMPGGARYSHTDFTIGSKGYVGLGYGENNNPGGYFKDFWAYDSGSDTWSSIADYPGDVKLNPSSFPSGGKGYVYGGQTQEYQFSLSAWEYDPAGNSWLRKSDFPFPVSEDIQLTGITYLTDFEGNMFDYNPDSETFQKITSNSAVTIFDWLVLEGSIYFFTEYPTKATWRFNSSTKVWSTMEDPVPMSYNYGNLNFSTDRIGFSIDLVDNAEMYGYTPVNSK